MAKRNALGRGLGALIDDAGRGGNEPVKKTGSSVNEISIEQIQANPFQPRTNFDEEALNDLANSIREIGIIQPITLRKIADDEYQLIAGERRLRASKLAGLKAIPAYVRDTDDNDMLALALVENIQREDLDAIEVALSYQRLMDECQLTQEALTQRVGKKRSTIANYLRLLRLPAIIQKGIRDKEISMGHARALVNIDDAETQIMLFRQIVKYDFSVRKVEEIVRDLNSEKPKAAASQPKYPQEYTDLKSHLDQFFKTKVDFKINDKGRGKISIPFKSSGDLERIIGILDSLNS
ncbi:ParB/RepB/Spo0J family partition protein [Prolixibacteraceae bacterium JC049]|jgi:ParB family chromosome partitioning protein|nr:ParB/RepB/Spo0J family partition protein [Prolixibacteraceae bacterium JC049]